MYSFFYAGTKQSNHRLLKNAVLAAYGCNEKYIKITDKNGNEVDFLEEFAKIENMGKDWYKRMNY